jgi:hypothetical protein
MLSSDSGDQTAYLLGQISRQLTALSPNGTYTSPTPFPTYSPSLSIILVNCFWALSLVLSLSSAVVATLMQQWARRYIRLPQIPSLPRDKARVRGLLFLGVLKYRMPRTFEVAALLLHLSVFLFFAGLVLFFFTIFKAVAIVISICVGLFAFVYLILTILPCLDYRCPYVTPMSSIWWYCWHTSLGFVTLSARWLSKRLHGVLVPYSRGNITSSKQRILKDWWELLDASVKKHEKRLKDGIRGTILWRAMDASVDVDPKTLIWLLNGPPLADKTKIQAFLARIPGDTIVQLMGCPVQYRNIFTQYLSTLMRSCTPTSIGLDEDTRRRRLIVCLNAIHHIARAFSDVSSGVSLPETLLQDLRINFANVHLMRPLWTDKDPTIRVTSRSICALLARHIKYPPRDSELAWLQDVLGQPPTTIHNALEGLGNVDNMNIDSFAHGVLSGETGDLPAEPAVAFVDTLAILMNARDKTAILENPFKQGFSELLRRAENDHHLREVANKLHRVSEAMFRSPLARSL